MANTMIQFMVENLWFYLPIGAAGIIVTLVLYFSGTRTSQGVLDDLAADQKTVGGRRFNIFSLLYFIFWAGLVSIGIVSGLIVPTLVGGVIALVPFIALILARPSSFAEGSREK